MTQQSAVLLIAFLAGLVVAAVLLGIRKTECSTQGCNGHRSTGDTRFG